MSSNDPQPPDHSLSPLLVIRKRSAEDGTGPRVKGKLIPVNEEYRVRLLLFTQRSRSETAVEVAHNILQTEDPFTNQLEELRNLLDTSNFFTGPLMPFRTAEQISSQLFEYDFHIIHLIMAKHFQIPFNTQAYCQLIDNQNISPVNFPFYVIKTKISFSKINFRLQQIQPEQIHNHIFCIRSFLNNDGTRIWVVLDSIFFIKPYHPIEPYHFVPFVIGEDLSSFLFGTYGEENKRRVNKHLRSFLYWVSDEPDSIEVYGFFPNELEKLDHPIHQDIFSLNQRDVQFDASLRLIHRPYNGFHDSQSGAVQSHYLDELYFFE